MKKTLSLLLAVLMLLGMMAGCSSEPANTTDPVDSAVNEATDTTPETPADNSEDISVEPADTSVDASDEPSADTAVAWADLPATTLPVSDELATFTCWISDAVLPNEKTNILDFNENQVMQELEKRTNVHWEFELAQSSSLTEKFNLMIMSGDWTDLISGTAALFSGGYDKYIEDEIIIDIKDLVAEYAPHYQALMNEDETVRKELLTDSGYMSGFQQLYPDVQPNWMGYFVRQDWLDASGIGYLETYEDWDQFLAWVSENTDATGLFLSSTTGQQGMIMAGFGAGTGMLQENGQLYFSPITDEYKAYVAQIAEWYGKGYVDKDYASNNFFGSMGNFTSGEYALFPHMYTYFNVIEGMGQAEDANFDLCAAQAPVMNEGEKILVNPGMLDSRLGGQRACISATCENPELLTQWYDYLYSEEGAFLCNYGLEGEAYNIVDGEIVLTDNLTANPNGWAYGEVMNLYVMASYFPYYYDWSREFLVVSDEGIDSCYTWYNCWDIPNQKSISSYVSLTTEESEDISSCYTDINTYVSEFTSKVIIGEESLDNWDSYVENIRNMGIDEIVETYQAAYDRYLAR